MPSGHDLVDKPMSPMRFLPVMGVLGWLNRSTWLTTFQPLMLAALWWAVSGLVDVFECSSSICCVGSSVPTEFGAILLPRWLAAEPDEAWLLGKSDGTLAGVPFFECVFRKLGCEVEWHLAEGAAVVGVQHVATVRGPRRKLLLGERTALNILTRASGIATEAAKVAAIKAEAGWGGEVAGTRKITPGFRLVEKYALLVGGCSTHRMDLSHMVMLKDNHVWAAGSITAAVGKARAACGFSSKIEVEARTLAEAEEAAAAGADVVMLDNFTPEGLTTEAPAL
jgi:nicotinate-nucleotide pyrophosphorylase (carboxylating)